MQPEYNRDKQRTSKLGDSFYSNWDIEQIAKPQNQLHSAMPTQLLGSASTDIKANDWMNGMITPCSLQASTNSGVLHLIGKPSVQDQGKLTFAILFL